MKHRAELIYTHWLVLTGGYPLTTFVLASLSLHRDLYIHIHYLNLIILVHGLFGVFALLLTP